VAGGDLDIPQVDVCVEQGVIMVGTWRDSERVTFAVCHGRRPAVVVELTGQRFDQIVVTVEDPDEVVARLA
jgi:hypothetical protein